MRCARDEIGGLGEGFNKMADALADFHRSNLGETLKAKETLESTLAALPNAVIVVDPAGRITARNSMAQAVLEACGASHATTMEELPLPADQLQAIRGALEGNRRYEDRSDYNRSLSIKLDGRSRKLLPTVVPIPQVSENLFGAVVVLDDVTDFARLDELRTELIALVSHELKTPLTTLRMNLLMLRENAETLNQKQREILDAAIAGCEDLSGTIDELLDLSRIEAGQLRLMKERVDLNALVHQAVARFRGRFAAAGVELRLDSLCPNAIVWGDGSRLVLVVSNLLSNALKYTPSGGYVTVSVSRQNAAKGGPEGLQIAVTDSGRGIPEEFRDRIFEKFFRVEQHGRPLTSVPGAGFGLYLCRQIVEAHAGRIRCEGREGASGTKIAFDLPVESPRAS